MKSVRIGSGAGYAGDRIEPAIELMEHGDLDYIIFECLAERTISIAQKRKQRDPNHGYNDLFEYRFDKILDVLKKKKVKVITNMGAANPEAAACKCREMATAKGIENLKICYITGDDVSSRLAEYKNLTVLETGRPLSEIKGEILSANGYIGAQGIVEALNDDADIIITGRVADPSLTLGALIYHFNWSMEDYTRLGRGTLVGHLLECAGQVTGGYYADPGKKDVPELWNLGFPIAEVDEEGNCIISKLEQAGGLVSVDTVKEQVLYEIQDPENYYTPDVIADFSKVTVTQIGDNLVQVQNADGKAPNGFFKTSIGYHDCYIGEGQITYGGENALARTKLAEQILKYRYKLTKLDVEEIRYDYIGVNSLYGTKISQDIGGIEPVEIRLRVTARTNDRATAERIGEEVEALYTNGPYGGGGVDKKVKDIISIASLLIPKHQFEIKPHYLEKEVMR